MNTFDKEKKSWLAENQPLGKRLGYPDCCIQAFCDQPPAVLEKYGVDDNDRLRLQMGTLGGKFSGFVPCLAHAKQIAEGKITLSSLIQENRDPQLPSFPFAFTHPR